MAEFDFAIAGTDVFSGLLAGLLARDHGKKIVRIGQRPSPQRLWRSLPLALPIATRPGRWRMAIAAERDTRALLASIGAAEALGIADVALLGDTPDTRLALDHLAHMAVGHGRQVATLDAGWAVRGVTTLERDVLDRHIAEWLKTLGVAMAEDLSTEPGITVLADDAAILDHLPEDARPGVLISQSMTSTSIVSTPGLQFPIVVHLDRSVRVVSRPGRTLLALVAGEHQVDDRLAASLPPPFPKKRLATTRYRRLLTTDGAPLIGKLKGSRRFVVAGLGDLAAFMAPAVARLLAGTSEGDEKAWFAAHDPAKPRASLADFVPHGEAAL